jgi:hypothetical protein
LALERGLLDCFVVPGVFDSLPPFFVEVELRYLLVQYDFILGSRLARFDDSAAVRSVDPRTLLAVQGASLPLVSSSI